MSTNCLELCRCPKRFSCTASSSSSSQTRLHRQRKLYARPQRRSLPSQSYSASPKPFESSRLHPRCDRTACCRMQKVTDRHCTARKPHNLSTCSYRLINSECFRTDPVSALVGVHRIWTNPKYRRKGVAVKLLEHVAGHSVYGMPALGCNDIAFSQPTSAGQMLFAAWAGTPHFLVFDPP